MTGNGIWSFVLAGSSSDGVDFHSKEATNDPQLVITMGAADTQAPTVPTLSGRRVEPDAGRSLVDHRDRRRRGHRL